MSTKKRKNLLNRFNQTVAETAKAELLTFEALLNISDDVADFLRNVQVTGGSIDRKTPLSSTQPYTLHVQYKGKSLFICAALGEASYIEDEYGDTNIIDTDEEAQFVEQILRKCGVKPFLVDLIEIEKNWKPGYVPMGLDKWENEENRSG